MRVFIVFLAMLASWCTMAATLNFMGGDEFWGWIMAICAVVNLANMTFWLFVATEPR